MSRWQARREQFRQILQGTQCVHPASVHDPVSVRIAQHLGFEMGMFAGSVASLAVLGAPDLIVLTLTEFADQAQRISRASDLPLMTDADHGYGNALNVMRTVEELEMAGVAGLSIEDTDLPSPYGSKGKARLLSIDEGVGKMRAAVAARTDASLMIAGRTSAPAISGLTDTITRAKAYEKTGVDFIFLVGMKTRNDLDAVAAEIHLPIMLGSAPAELMDREYLASRGVKVCLQGHQPFAAATKALHDTMKHLRDGGDPALLKPQLASAELTALSTRADDYEHWSRDFLG